MTPRTNALGYKVIKLIRGDGTPWFPTIHRLMAMTYLGVSPKQPVDHINGDKSDNRISNLRVCTAFQNQGNRKISKNNTSGFKGVCRLKTGRWQMSCRANGKDNYSWHDTKEEAARAYDAVAIQAHGEFARLNFPR